MKQTLNRLKHKILTHRYFLRNFLLIFIVMAALFSVFAIFTYQRSRQIIEEEFTTSSIQELENISSYVDSFIMDTQYMISTLAISEYIQFFFTSPSPEAIFNNYSAIIQEQLMTLKNSNEAIENIYLYSDASNSIYTANNHTSLYSFDDRFWIEQLSPDNNGFSIFPYSVNGRFPYVICVAKELAINGNRSIIAILINPSKLSFLQEIAENNYQEAYLVSDEEKVIYREHQNSLLEPLEISAYLSHYDGTVSNKSSIDSNTGNPYLYTQLHSSKYPWSYILVTHLQDYYSRLSSSRAVLYALTFAFIVFTVFFAVFLSLRSLKPVKDIRKFLDNPNLLSENNAKNDSEIKYIASRITQYIQTNKQLADELNKRLNLLNKTQMTALQAQINPHFLFNTLNMMHILATDSLGYNHSLPQMILDLSSLLRYALEPAETVSFKTELSYTDIYLSVLNQRYGETLTIVQNINPDTLDAKVPKLFIQPIIENAVFHGFSKKHNSECILTISCYRQEIVQDNAKKIFVALKIQDNGIGMKEETLNQLRNILADKKTPSGKNIGLRNVMQRMNLTYSEKSTMTITSTVNEGSCFTLVFPYVN